MQSRAEEEIRNDLVPGERLIWCGRPRGGGLDLGYVFIILFLLVWSGLAANGARTNLAAERPRAM